MGLKYYKQTQNILLLQELKSDQNGIEMSFTFLQSTTILTLKSDQNGIEMKQTSGYGLDMDKLKSDQNGIEIEQFNENPALEDG